MRLRMIILALALTTASCGGGNRSTPAGSVEAGVKRSATSVIVDARKSCSLLTDNALAAYTAGRSGAAGRRRCETQVARGTLPKTAKVTVLEVDGDRASVGYTTSQVTGAMQLVRQRGTWKMDSITTITKR